MAEVQTPDMGNREEGTQSRNKERRKKMWARERRGGKNGTVRHVGRSRDGCSCTEVR